MKAVVAQFDAGELITQRELVSQKVSEDLTERAKQFGVILDDISIVRTKNNLACIQVHIFSKFRGSFFFCKVKTKQES